MTAYDIAAVAYGAVILLIFVYCSWPLLFGSKLKPSGPLFRESPHFTEEQRDRLEQHYERIRGTLEFWKGKAKGFVRVHYYCVVFTIVSSWAVPLISATAPDISHAKWLILAMSSHIALAISLHRGLNVADNMRVFRHGESEFYDLTRKLLDSPKEFGVSAEEQINSYFQQVADLRRFVRRQETECTPVVEYKKGADTHNRD